MQTYVGASKAKKIWEGDWFDLWQEITGRKPGTDLSRVFPVQLGILTEDLNLDFLEYQTGWKLDRSFADHTKEPIRHSTYPHMGCHPDGMFMLEQHPASVNAKHTYSGSYREGTGEKDRVVEEYYWQQIHEACVVQDYLDGTAEFGILSVIFGNKEPAMIKTIINHDHLRQYTGRLNDFWWHVENDEPPATEKLDTPPVHIKYEKPIEWNMAERKEANLWGDVATMIKETETSIKANKDAKDQAKALIIDHPEVAKAYGNGIEVRRNKKGSLSVHIQ